MNPLLMKNIAYIGSWKHIVFVFVCLWASLSLYWSFVSLGLGQCHHQMISFQKIYGFYSLKHHTVEINGNVTLEDTHTDTHTYIHVNIELEFCETEFAIRWFYEKKTGPTSLLCSKFPSQLISWILDRNSEMQFKQTFHRLSAANFGSFSDF